MRFSVHAYYSICAWACVVALVFSQPDFLLFEDLFLNKPPDDSGSLFLDDDYSGGGGPSSYATQPQSIVDADLDLYLDDSALMNSAPLNLHADAFSDNDDAPPDECINMEILQPSSLSSSFKNIRARAANSCKNPIDVDVERTEGKNVVMTAEEIQKYWCTDFTAPPVQSFGSVPVCYGSEELSPTGEGILRKFRTGFDQSADYFRTLYNCVLSKILI